LSIDPAALGAQLLVLVLLLLASALFSGSEVALFSLDSSAREALALASDRASTRVLALLENPRQLLVTILILNTIVNVGAAILAALMVASVAHALGWNPTWTVLSEMVALTFVLLVVSEITPKLIASRHAPAYSRNVSGLLAVLHHVLGPVSRRLASIMAALQQRFTDASSHRLSPEDLKAMAEIGEAHGTLEEEERELIHSIVEFGETTVREVMVSRLDVVALSVSSTLDDALAVIRDSGHSRLPLYVEHLDNILGIVYAKDLLPYLTGTNGTPKLDWTRIARPPMFVPLGKRLDDLLRDFQSKKMHLAIVVDEYGGTAGLVTMEDILEEIVGDIRDEHDDGEEPLYQKLDEYSYRFDARINLDDLNEVLGIELETEDFDFETLGGLIFHLAGAIPSVGDEVEYGSLRMTVETTEHHRIGRVLVELNPAGPEWPAERRSIENS
jgi:putative hemolysin